MEKRNMETLTERWRENRKKQTKKKQYKTEQNETIAIVQAGYADGIPTELSNKGEVEIGGTVYPIVGKISMDLVAISCRNMKLNIDQEAIFWGSDNMNFRLENLAGKYKKIWVRVCSIFTYIIWV